MNYELEKIQKSLKGLMRKKKMSYEDLARELNLSPASIKRRLNGHDLSITQIQELTNALSVSFYELVELSKQENKAPHLFTEEQELVLGAALRNVHVFRMVLAGQSFGQMKAHLKVSDAELRQILKQLEKVQLTELLPKDRIRPTVRFPVRWRPGGHLEQTYNKAILQNIMRRIEQNGKQAGINKQFEFALSDNAYRTFCAETEGVFLKYRSLSEVHLSQVADKESLVSGILFIDTFSLWD